MMPANAIVRHPLVEQRVLDLAEYAETCPFNRVEMGDPQVGIITSGAVYGYTREALPGASYLKLGMTFPLPKKLIADFRAKVEKLYVVEESDPFLEEAIRLMGIKIDGGKELNTLLGEINARLVALSLAKAGVPGVNPDLLGNSPRATPDLPSRPPTFCPGCSHRGLFVVLKKLRVFVSGDIGCYTMGALARRTTRCTAAPAWAPASAWPTGWPRCWSRRPRTPSPICATSRSGSSATAPSSTPGSPPSWTWSTTTATRSTSSSTTAPPP